LNYSSLFHCGFCEKEKIKEGAMPDWIDINCDMGESLGAYKLGRITRGQIMLDQFSMIKNLDIVEEA
jgi:hypothetical protein